MSRTTTIAATLAVFFAASTAAQALQTTVHVARSDRGNVLVNDKGMALYVFDKDAPGRSNCSWFCAVAWPPALASASATTTKRWSVVKRDSGVSQWAYRGRPLYTYVKDTRPGEISGDGAEGVWHVARP
jgi:predicted lipoprotein with Yx(FWY)xxD motif